MAGIDACWVSVGAVLLGAGPALINAYQGCTSEMHQRTGWCWLLCSLVQCNYINSNPLQAALVLPATSYLDIPQCAMVVTLLLLGGPSSSLCTPYVLVVIQYCTHYVHCMHYWVDTGSTHSESLGGHKTIQSDAITLGPVCVTGSANPTPWEG